MVCFFMAKSFQERLNYYREKLKEYRLQIKAREHVIDEDRKFIRKLINNGFLGFYLWAKEKFNKILRR